jgi:hypothetical protein
MAPVFVLVPVELSSVGNMADDPVELGMILSHKLDESLGKPFPCLHR